MLPFESLSSCEQRRSMGIGVGGRIREGYSCEVEAEAECELGGG